MFKCEKSSSLGSGLTADFHVCVGTVFFCEVQFLKETLTVRRSSSAAG